MSMDRVDRAVELLFRLSIFGFSQLCASDQRQEIEEIHNKLVHQGIVELEKPPEESEKDFRVSTFTDLFHKLPFHEHDLFLSRVIKKFKRGRQLGELISWFSTQLDANDQQEVIGKIVDATAVHDERTNEDFRLRRFAQLSQNYTEYVYKLLVPWMEDHIKKRRGTQDTTSEKETTSDWQSRFAEFYLAFSTVWFKGQTADSQRWLIEYPNSGGVKGTDTVSVIYRKLWYSTDQDFRLREFSDLLSKKVLSFGTQLRLLDTVEQELRYRTSLPRGMNLQTDLSGHAAAELISHLLTFGFSLLSAADQQKKIEVLSVEVGAVYIERLAEESEEDFRIRTLASLTAKAIFFSRADLLFDVSKKFFCERKLSDLTVLIRKSGSNGHKHLMEQLFDWLMETYYSSKYAKDVIIQKFFEENEEEFMLRRFLKLCTTHPSLWDCQEVEKWELTSMLQTKSGNADTKDIRCESVSVPPNNFSSRYAEFYLGLSIIWFKTRCANEPRNPIEVLLGEVEGDTIEKLRGESEEDFRFRRFVESFKQLLFSSQEYMVEYILKTLLDNLVEYSKLFPDAEAAYAYAYWIHEDFPFGVQFMKR